MLWEWQTLNAHVAGLYRLSASLYISHRLTETQIEWSQVPVSYHKGSLRCIPTTAADLEGAPKQMCGLHVPPRPSTQTSDFQVILSWYLENSPQIQQLKSCYYH